MSKIVFGVFTNRDKAEHTITELEHRDFNPKDISVMMKDTAQAKEVHDTTGADVAGGATSGATTGALVGGLAGLLTGIGAIAIPGLGAFLIGGPLAAALGLSGAAATTATGALTGAVAGGLIGALMGLGFSREEAEVYETKVKEGAILLAVPTKGDDDEEVRTIFQEHGASNIKAITTKNAR